MRHSFLIGIVFVMEFALGCGYTFQNSKNPLLAKEGIRKVYVSPIINNTFKVGIENTVFNELIRTLNSQKRITIVREKSEADAILTGTIIVASYVTTGSASVGSLSPAGVGASLPTATYPIATQYTSTLTCSFALTGVNAPPPTFAPSKKKASSSTKKVEPGKRNRPYQWASIFSRTKPFPGSNQLDVPGTTSPLINDSEFERALSDIAHSMMTDVHESMLAMF